MIEKFRLDFFPFAAFFCCNFFFEIHRKNIVNFFRSLFHENENIFHETFHNNRRNEENK